MATKGQVFHQACWYVNKELMNEVSRSSALRRLATYRKCPYVRRCVFSVHAYDTMADHDHMMSPPTPSGNGTGGEEESKVNGIGRKKKRGE